MAIREKIAVRENGLIMVSGYMIPNCSSKVTHKVSHYEKKDKKTVLAAQQSGRSTEKRGVQQPTQDTVESRNPLMQPIRVGCLSLRRAFASI